MAASHLVVLFCATAGQNGENLGSDEEQIVLFVYLLYDVANNKSVCLQQHYVRPTADDISETVLTEECKIQTGLSEDAIRNAQPLEQVLEEFDQFLRTKEVHPDHGGRPFVFCVDGQLHHRLCLHPEACRKNIQLPKHFYSFFDLRKEFKKFYKNERPINCIKDMLDSVLGTEEDQSVEYGVKQCQEMSNIIQKLINDGHTFQLSEVDVVKDRLEPGICRKDEVVDEESVIRARGLPWQSSDQDIARFFQGLNIAKGGVALCLSQQGRRNGEALIRFESKEHRDLALRKHKHHLGQRYIEVYRASGKDFINVAGGNNTEAQAFLSRHSDNGNQVIVRMRGLPYTCTAEQVTEFFRQGEQSAEVLDGEEGILFVHQADGRATGDAFVLFANDEEASKALSKHRESIGTRYIELFKSTTAEVQQVLNRSMDPRTPSTEAPEPHMPPLLPQIPTSPLPGMLLPQQVIASSPQRDCIRMRGLPFEATVTDILTFLGEHSRNIVFQGVHMVYNAQGTPSGEAFIQMDSEQSAEAATMAKHRKFMINNNKRRYIEVLQCSGEDMNLVLTTGVPTIGGPPPAAAAPGIQGMLPTHIPGATMLPKPLTMSPGQYTLASTMLPDPLTSAQYTLTSPMLPKSVQLSPGGTVLQPQMQLGVPTTVGYPAPVSVYSPYTQQLAPQQSLVAPGPPTMAATALTGGLPPGATFAPGIPRSTGMTATTYPTAGAAGYQPIMYWYPSPPVSPQSAYYVHACPTTVVVKGLPFNIQVPEILAFFEGIYEMQPDVQIRTQDGRFTGEAYITFGSRGEAERAVTERNRKVIGNRFIEVYMA